jgi:uncharacterized protein YdiU (UPF0061 family)
MIEQAIPAEAVELAEQTGTIATIPASIVIKGAADYEAAGERLKQFSAKEKEVEELRKKLKAPILAAGKAIDAFFETPLRRLASARAAYKVAILGFQQEQERIRQAQEAAALEEARKEREKLEARAAKLAEKGKTEKAEAVAAAAAAVVTPMLPTTTAKLSGISNRTTYSAVVSDFMELVRAVAAGTVPANALQVNQPFLNNQARAMKETLNYPGVKAVATTGLAA